LTTLGSHSTHAFKATHSKFIQFTFHFYKCFYKFGHAKEPLVKRVSKGQRAITSMKSVRVFFEHCCCLVFSSKDSSCILIANKNGTAKKNLMQKTSCLSDKPRRVLLGTLGFAMVMQYTSMFQSE